ncbi:MAG: hypothetical protein HYU66_00255 [Armatimonadetes bacterium]|nr:hypothetical protein [Armatimonadota bacterium]
MRELKISPGGVRGVVGSGLTPELTVDFACAFATWCGGEAVAVARDTRRSSEMIRAAVVAGLLSGGCEVIDLGVGSSPLASFAARELGAGGGIAITGSHNDARWNALKFFGPDGLLLNAVAGEELLDVYHAAAYRLAPAEAMLPPAAAPEVEERYLEHLLAALDGEAIRARGFRVAVDFCNGSCAPLAARFLAALRCELVPLNDEPSGEFAHLPAPTAANMRQLATLTRYLGADLGAAVNVDGDRIGFVTAEGRPLSEEYALPLAALNRMERRPGLVVTNHSTSRMVEAVAARYGQQVQRTPVGEGYVVDCGVAEEAVLAGEGSGGVAILPATMTFDALLTLGVVLETLATTGAGLAELVAQLPAFAVRKSELACPPDLVYRCVEAFRDRHAAEAPDTSDGVRVAWPDGWLHVRASNTEPLLRVIAEADTAERADAIHEAALTFARRVAFGHEGG